MLSGIDNQDDVIIQNIVDTVLRQSKEEQTIKDEDKLPEKEDDIEQLSNLSVSDIINREVSLKYPLANSIEKQCTTQRLVPGVPVIVHAYSEKLGELYRYLNNAEKVEGFGNFWLDTFNNWNSSREDKGTGFKDEIVELNKDLTEAVWNVGHMIDGCKLCYIRGENAYFLLDNSKDFRQGLKEADDSWLNGNIQAICSTVASELGSNVCMCMYSTLKKICGDTGNDLDIVKKCTGIGFTAYCFNMSNEYVLGYLLGKLEEIENDSLEYCHVVFPPNTHGLRALFDKDKDFWDDSMETFEGIRASLIGHLLTLGYGPEWLRKRYIKEKDTEQG